MNAADGGVAFFTSRDISPRSLLLAPCANKDKYASVTFAVNKLLSGKSSPKIALIASNDWTRAFPSALLCTAF
ncbi:hypothetical protein ACLB1S_15395 [Escherichia coli]